MNKHSRDNRSRQLNPKDPTFHSSRGTLPPPEAPPPTGTPLPVPNVERK